MQLLFSQATPGPEFASFSVLYRSDVSGDTISCHMGEPLLVPSPLSTVSQTSCVEALAELHLYINSIFKAGSKHNNIKDKALTRFLLEDEKSLLIGSNSVDGTQIFRPQKCHGIALQYRLIRDKKRISCLFPLLLHSSKSASSTKNPAGLEKEITGMVLCVGVSGIPSMFGTSTMIHSMSQRMDDCIDLLCKAAVTVNSSNNTTNNNANSNSETTKSPPMDPKAACSLLTTLLLTEDEDRMTNTMANASNRIVTVHEEEVGGGLLGGVKRRNVDNNNNMGMGDDDDNALRVNSADQARIVVERLAVLSVCQSDTAFRKFEGRNNNKDAEKGSKKRLRKTTKDADLDGFDFRGEVRSTPNTNNITSTSSVSSGTATTVPSSGASFSQRSTTSSSSTNFLKSSKKDSTSTRSMNSTSRQPVPPASLLKSNKDESRSKRMSSGNMGTSSRSRNSRRSTGDPFGSSTHSKQSVRSIQSDATSKTPSRSQSHSSRSNQANFDPFQEVSATNLDGFGGTSNGNDGGGAFLAGGNHRDGAAAKVLVNIALNEDLTCFYKLSKMSSCSVEGVVQVQVKSNLDQGVPFLLLMRDPSKHIQSIQENKKFADSMAGSLSAEPPATRPDYMFTVSVPKADNYFPVMRYKCGDELRPVPIVSCV